MKMSGAVEWALHCCVVLTSAGRPVPSQRLAELHDVSATYLAKQLQALARAGIVRSSQGSAGGYAMDRDPAQVSVLDVVQAVEGKGPAFVCREIRQQGPLAAPAEECTAPCGIAKVMRDAELAWQASLASVSVADLARHLGDTLPEERMARLSGWLQG